MVSPEPDHERKQAEDAATAALEHAEQMAERARRIADGWRQSRADNNYRAMLRMLVLANGEGQ